MFLAFIFAISSFVRSGRSFSSPGFDAASVVGAGGWELLGRRPVISDRRNIRWVITILIFDSLPVAFAFLQWASHLCESVARVIGSVSKRYAGARDHPVKQPWTLKRFSTRSERSRVREGCLLYGGLDAVFR